MKPVTKGLMIGMELARFEKIADASEYQTLKEQIEKLISQNKTKEASAIITNQIAKNLKQNQHLKDSDNYKQGWIAYAQGDSLLMKDSPVSKEWATGFLSRQYSQYLN